MNIFELIQIVTVVWGHIVGGYQLLALRDIIGYGLALVTVGLIELGLVGWLLLRRNGDKDSTCGVVVLAFLLALIIFVDVCNLSNALLDFAHPSRMALLDLLGLR
jgi:hypothetical protein